MTDKFKMLWLLVIVFILSCSKDNSLEIPSLPQNNSSKISNSDILKYANAKFGKTKGNTIDIKPICKNNDTLAYIVNYGTGWELLSGDKQYTPILARGEGSYNIEELNPGQRIWLDSELETIKAIKNKNIIVPEKDGISNQRFWNRIRGPVSDTKAEGDPIEGWELVEILEMGATRTTSGHILKTQWGQNHPWNQCVPYATGINSRCVAGCVAVAGAQMLKFIHDTLGKPVSFYTTGSCSGYENSPQFTFSNSSSTAWDAMALTSDESITRTYQTSLLIGWIGYKVGMKYSLNSSSAYSGDLKNLIEDLSIDCSSDDYNATTVWSQVCSGWPVYIRASTDENEGHAWIIDGYCKVKTEYRYIYEYTEYDSPYNEYGDVKYETEYETTNYILMNWGWNNNIDNSLYALTGARGWAEGGYIFTNEKKIIYGFK